MTTVQAPARRVQDELVVAAGRLIAGVTRAGGTLWWTGPGSWPAPPARAPALPLTGTGRTESAGDRVAVARSVTRAGDLLLQVGPAHDPVLTDLARRAPAWGLTVVWVALAGPPPAGAADQILTLPADAGSDQLQRLLAGLAAAADEHADDSDLPGAGQVCDGPVCITCSDEGRLAEVVEVDGPTARVRTAGGVEEVDLTLVGSAARHDLLLIHAGTAITRLPAGPVCKEYR